MKGVKGSSFGVRFYRRAGARITAKETAQADIANNVEDVAELERAMTQRTVETVMMSDIPEQLTKQKHLIHPQQELTAPRAEQTVMRSDDKEKALWLAAKSGDCYKIRVLVMDGVDLDARDAQGRTAVNIATQYNQKEALKTLLAAKEMRYMAHLGELPQTKFYKKFDQKKYDKSA